MDKNTVEESLKYYLRKAFLEDFDNDSKRMLRAISEFINGIEIIQNKKSTNEFGSEIISLENVTKSYKVGGERIDALSNVSLSIKEGEFIGVMGTSGSGKSTLLNVIGGLDKPTSGKAKIGEYQLGKLTDKQTGEYRNTMIGFVFQFFYLQPFLNVRQNVEIPLLFRGLLESERRKISEKIIETVGLGDRINHLPSQLSGGQMQRVAIARAVVNNPKIILADEPTGNLDSRTGGEILDLLSDLNREKNTTIVIVTHDESIVSRCNRVFRMMDGFLTE